jgi:hypothetical protein
MRAVLAALVAAVLSARTAPAGAAAEVGGDGDAIRQAALDYAEGYYEGSAERMARAVHPALLKRGLLPPGAADRFLSLMGAETLIDLAASGRGQRPADARRLDFALLDSRGDVASARIFTALFDDYLLLARQDGRWRIVSVLWQVPASAGGEPDRAAVTRALEEFSQGLWAFDAAGVRAVVHPEMVWRTLRPGAGGGLVLDDLNVDRLLGELRRVPAEKGGSAQVLDVHDRIASARITWEKQGSYVHLAKQDGRWRIVNVLSR